MRGKGINYDTGFTPAGQMSRPDWDPAQVEREIQVIAGELHCTAVRISGGDPERLSTAADFAAAAGLEVWFAPFPCELSQDETRAMLLDCADRAERLRQTGADVVFVAGCELSLFGSGFMPGETFAERMTAFGRVDLAGVQAQLSEYLGSVASDARRHFGGNLTYAAGPWEDLDWSPLDIVAVDGYRDASNRDAFPYIIKRLFRHGKPVVITEYGCCTYAGAADRGGMGWAIIDHKADPVRLDGDYVRDEDEQVRYLTELHAIFEAQGVDSAFWFTFAGFRLVHREDPRTDLDMASYGVIALLDENGAQWRPKKSFHALAGLYA